MVELIYNVVSFYSIAKWPTYTYIYILFRIFYIMFYHKWLDVFPCAIQQDLIAYPFYLFLFFNLINQFFPPLFRATPAAYGGSQARGPKGAIAADLHHSSPQFRIRAMSVTYTTTHGDAGSLTHWARAGIKPTTSWFLVGFVSAAPQRELLLIHSKFDLLHLPTPNSSPHHSLPPPPLATTGLFSMGVTLLLDVSNSMNYLLTWVSKCPGCVTKRASY